MVTSFFSYLYLTVKNYKGTGYWLLWSLAETVGFLFVFSRQIPSIEAISIFVQNFMIILGVMFLYLGIVRFFERKPNYLLIFGTYASYVLLLLYFLVVDYG